mmetsp:Transcript_157872/g.502714  ORF Transcript_157872/g.502714 Transcript_157872/m.502714 type:complete len:340 (-) Transcript_157872:802-1821(-)
MPTSPCGREECLQGVLVTHEHRDLRVEQVVPFLELLFLFWWVKSDEPPGLEHSVDELSEGWPRNGAAFQVRAQQLDVRPFHLAVVLLGQGEASVDGISRETVVHEQIILDILLIFDMSSLDERQQLVAMLVELLQTVFVSSHLDLVGLAILGHALDENVGETEALWQQDVVDRGIVPKVATLTQVLHVGVKLARDVCELLFVLILQPAFEQFPCVLAHDLQVDQNLVIPIIHTSQVVPELELLPCSLDIQCCRSTLVIFENIFPSTFWRIHGLHETTDAVRESPGLLTEKRRLHVAHRFHDLSEAIVDPLRGRQVELLVRDEAAALQRVVGARPSLPRR